MADQIPENPPEGQKLSLIAPEMCATMIEQGARTLMEHIEEAAQQSDKQALKIRDHIMQRLDEIQAPEHFTEPERQAYNLAIIHAMDITDKMPDSFASNKKLPF